MRTALLASAVLFAVSAVSLPAMAQTSQPTSAPASVPVRRVSLFSSGVGFFEHAGTVNGDGSAALRFKTEQVNDVLKSLVLADLDGGSVSTVSYQSQDPLEHALKGFQVDLSDAPAMPQLLSQLRGADVVVKTSGNTFSGKILGVENRKKPGGVGDKGGAIDVPTLTLITSAGIQAVAIDEATSIQLTDAALQDELNKALAAVAGARDSDKKTVTINFKGAGERHVRLGYVVETPVWKTSYRLTLADKPDDKTNLQGWAIVENQTDSDWNNVSLSLVSGRPMSFVMDLYEPMYLERPEAKLDLFEGLTPQSYAEAKGEVFSGGGGPAAAAPVASRALQQSDRRLAVAAEMADKAGAAGGSVFFGGVGGESVAAQATGGQIGELFEYALKDITLARQTSAMVPIITEPIEATPVNIYNHNVLARYPLSGARIKNTTDKHLLQGPITVFAGNNYAGDAQINNVGPGQERLISYGVDLQTLVDADKTENNSEIQSLKLVKGVLEITNKMVQSHTFAMQNKSDKAKTIIIEETKYGGYDLVDTDKPKETTDAIYRFEKKLDPKQTAELVVKQQIINSQQTALISMTADVLSFYAKHGKTSEKVKQALVKAIELKTQQNDLDRQLAESNKELAKITDEQNRIRENMRTVDKDSAYYGRLMAKLDAQESTIEKTQSSIGDLTEQRDAKRAEFESYLGGLSVE